MSSALQVAWQESADKFAAVWRGAVSIIGDLFDDLRATAAKVGVEILNATGKINDQTAAALNAAIDQNTDKSKADRAKGDIKSQQKAGEKLAADLLAIETAKQNTIAELNKAETALSAGASVNAENEKAALTEKITGLRKQLAELNKTANVKAVSANNKEVPASIPTLKNKIADSSDALSKMMLAKVSVAGTFSAEAATRLDAGDISTRIVEAFAKQEAYLSRIAKGIDQINEPDLDE